MNKYILITGCSTGIGRASAEYCAHQGWQVYATVRKQSDVDHLNSLKLHNLYPLLLDITDLSSIKNVADRLQRELEQTGLDVLINNAAYGLSFPLEHADNDYICQHINTNITGTIAMTHAFLPLLKRAQGRIINISSGSGIVAIPLMAMYSATKFAIEGFSDALRVELQATGIKVIVMQLGVIETDLHQKIARNSNALRTQLEEFAWKQYKQSIIQSDIVHAQSRRYATKMESFTEKLGKAIQADKPKTRYRLGLDTRLMVLLSPFLNDRLKDLFWKKLLKF